MDDFLRGYFGLPIRVAYRHVREIAEAGIKFQCWSRLFFCNCCSDCLISERVDVLKCLYTLMLLFSPTEMDW